MQRGTRIERRGWRLKKHGDRPSDIDIMTIYVLIALCDTILGFQRQLIVEYIG